MPLRDACRRPKQRDDDSIVGRDGQRRTSRVLRRLAKQTVAGGRTYDVVIAECARKDRTETLLTFNRRHFDPPPAGVSVIEPA